MVTTHEAQFFPTSPPYKDGAFAYWRGLELTNLTSFSTLSTNQEESKNDENFGQSPIMATPWLFDRILCDVPCSGDGTMRKQPTIFSTWTPRDGYSLHNVQLSILVRAIENCRVGGKICYSTCSLNPLENEAVVSAILQRYPHQLRVVNVREEHPSFFDHFESKQGLTDWKCLIDKRRKKKKRRLNEGEEEQKEEENDKEEVEEPEKVSEEESEDDENDLIEMTFSQFKQDTLPSFAPKCLKQSMWSPSDVQEYYSNHQVNEEEEGVIPTLSCEEVYNQLQHCVRVLPHLNDSGGFFITIIKKIERNEPISSSSSSSSHQDSNRDLRRSKWREEYEEESKKSEEEGGYQIITPQRPMNGSICVTYTPIPTQLFSTLNQLYPHLSSEFVSCLFIRKEFNNYSQQKSQNKKKNKKRIKEDGKDERDNETNGGGEKEEKEKVGEDGGVNRENIIYYLSPHLSAIMRSESMNNKYQVLKPLEF